MVAEVNTLFGALSNRVAYTLRDEQH